MKNEVLTWSHNRTWGFSMLLPITTQCVSKHTQDQQNLLEFDDVISNEIYCKNRVYCGKLHISHKENTQKDG